MGLPCYNSSLNSNLTQRGPEDTSSTHLVELVKLIILDVAVPVMCALGLLGNLLSLVVLATERMHRTLTKMEISAHIGLIALAVSDFLFCLLVLIFTQVTPKPFYEEEDKMIYFDLLANGLITIFIIASTWLIVVMAAERYIAVCHPLRARRLISLRRTRIVIILVFLLCCLATVPIFLERTIVGVTCFDGRIVYQLKRRSKHSIILRRIMWAVFFDFIPCVALIYFNTCLIVKIHKAKRLRDYMTNIQVYGFRKTNTSDLRSTKQSRKQKGDSSVNGGNLKCSQSLLHQENSCMTRQLGDFDPDDRNKKQTNKDGLDTRLWTNGQGMDKGLSQTQTSWSEERTSSTHKSTAEVFKKDASKLNQSDHIIRRPVKTRMVKKRPSDSALNSVTATLVAVVILFLILVSPCEILKFSLSYTLRGEHKVVTYITNFMQVTNFSLNFVLYCTVNKSFRYTVKRLVFSCWHIIKHRC